MSDPVSNHDIEDVLSSIRRLVAQGDPRRNVPPTKPATAKTVVEPEKQEASVNDPTPERLVLTPAFRVLNSPEPDVDEEIAAAEPVAEKPDAPLSESESPDLQVQEPATSDAKPDPIDALSERAKLEEKIAELEAAVNGRNEEFEPDGSEVGTKDSFVAAFFGQAHTADLTPVEKKPSAPSNDAVVAEDAVASAPPQEPAPETALNDAVMDHIADTVADEIAGAFPHLTAADEEPETDPTVVQLNPDRNRRLAQEVAEASRGPDAAPFQDEVQSDLAFVSKARAETLAEEAAIHPTTASPETVEDDGMGAAASDVSETGGTPMPEPEIVEPVTDETPTFRRAYRDVYDPVAEATADAAEAAPDRGDIYGDELAPDPEQMGTSVAAAAAPGALMDPDMLRDMVGQMIREELQGEMGERITRNVRKLVRREINRVLSAQELG